MIRPRTRRRSPVCAGCPDRWPAAKETSIHQLERRGDFEAVFLASPDPILLVGRDGLIRDANSESEIMFGWSRDEMVGKSVELLVPQALRDAHRRHRSQYGRQPVLRPMGLGMELHAVGKDGVEFPVEISLGPSMDRFGELLVVCIVRSLTGSEVLRRVAAARIAAAESERTRIAGELHDSVKQGLTAIQLHLAALVEMKLAPEEAAGMVTHLQHELDVCHDSLDRAIRDLMPVELEGQALGFALTLLCRRAEEEGFAVERDIRWAGDVLDGEACLAVFRIVQEGLNNARRHSGAGSATVRYWEEDRRVRVEVSDSGTGFSPDDLEPRQAVGLATMRERSQIIGGRLTVASAPGAGTSVLLELPLGANPPSRDEPV